MLTSTFIHIGGINFATERALWEQGALSWHDFLAEPKRWLADGAEMAKVARAVERSSAKLGEGEYQFFARRLPRREHWRCFPEFRDSAVYLDIETVGGFGEDSITVIGLYDGIEYKAFIKDENMAEFPDAISRYSTVVTFFGGGFDIPMLRKSFPTIELDQFHIDLCPTMRRLGYRGGLKSIEMQLGIERSPETKGLTGRDAVRLWRRYMYGNSSALDTLLAYNRDDVVNLERLMETAYFDLRLLVMGSESTER